MSESNAKKKSSKDTLRNLNTEKCWKGPEEQPNMKLFDSDSEEDNVMDSQDTFQVKPQYEGKHGQKLMELQRRIGNDPRFQLDERFIDSSSEEEQDKDWENQPFRCVSSSDEEDRKLCSSKGKKIPAKGNHFIRGPTRQAAHFISSGDYRRTDDVKVYTASGKDEIQNDGGISRLTRKRRTKRTAGKRK